MSELTAKIHIPQSLYKFLLQQDYAPLIRFKGYEDESLRETFKDDPEWVKVTEDIKKSYKRKKHLEEEMMVKLLLNKDKNK